MKDSVIVYYKVRIKYFLAVVFVFMMAYFMSRLYDHYVRVGSI